MRLPNLDQAISFANIVVMVLLIGFILLQNKSGGLSTVFGGSGVVSSRRGVEKWLFVVTIVFAVLFVGLSVTTLILK